MLTLRKMLYDRRHRHEVYSRPEFWNFKAQALEGDAVSMWPNNNLNHLYHAEQLSLLDEQLGDIAGKDVLDVGCGTGRIARHLAGRGARVVGVDFAENAVEIARRQSPSENPRYEVGSMFELQGEALYDAIVSWGSVAIACRDASELRRVSNVFHRLLRPGGRLLLLEPVHRGFLHRVLNMSVPDFCSVFTEAGFQRLTVKQLHFWPVRLALAYVPWPRWVTAPGYRIGQAMLALTRDTWGGDYKAIMASR